ncbi:MAG: Hdr-like menaquinol oxidoreductase cytochrome c subunit [Gammaproteobacteria bacterium]|nr:Hdr-like menaquinol oxidoreductase cytochrome c subunit [Gammaproteobacteria bacterium]
MAGSYRGITLLSTLLGGLLMAASLLASAGVSAPVVPQGKGEQCVEPTADMRKNHMEYLLHQRDKTMHQGIRSKQHSLKECINCHVQANKAGDYPSVHGTNSEQHFCDSCHSYAAVKIDCFDCHADRPASPSAAKGAKP